MNNRFNIVIKNDFAKSWKKEIDTEIVADNKQEALRCFFSSLALTATKEYGARTMWKLDLSKFGEEQHYSIQGMSYFTMTELFYALGIQRYTGRYKKYNVLMSGDVFAKDVIHVEALASDNPSSVVCKSTIRAKEYCQDDCTGGEVEIARHCHAYRNSVVYRGSHLPLFEIETNHNSVKNAGEAFSPEKVSIRLSISGDNIVASIEYLEQDGTLYKSGEFKRDTWAFFEGLGFTFEAKPLEKTYKIALQLTTTFKPETELIVKAASREEAENIIRERIFNYNGKVPSKIITVYTCRHTDLNVVENSVNLIMPNTQSSEIEVTATEVSDESK